jgi:hypothetical protein
MRASPLRVLEKRRSGKAVWQRVLAVAAWALAAGVVPAVLVCAGYRTLEDIWELAIPWWVGLFVSAAAWSENSKRRREVLRSSVVLHIEMLSPDKSQYHDMIGIHYRNNGTSELEATAKLYFYPSTRGRSEMWNPAFRDDFRDELMTLGPLETHELVLGPGECETYPYDRLGVTQAAGLHGFVPQWVTIVANVWPRGMGRLARETRGIFYLLWTPGREQTLPGTWHITRMRIRATRHFDNPKTREQWKQHLSAKVPAEFRAENVQDFTDPNRT